MELNHILTEYVGQMGRYQVLVILLILLVRWPSVIYNMGYDFFAATPDHWCTYQQYNHVINMTDDQWKLVSIPSSVQDGRRQFSQCQKYIWDSANTTAGQWRDILKAVVNGTVFSGRNQISCSNWDYDRVSGVHDSIVTEHNLVCDRTWLKSMVATAFVVGWIVGVPLAGYFGDRFGRRKVLLVTVAGTVGFGIGLPFCENLILFLLIRSLLSAFLNGALVICFTYAMELVGPQYRSCVNSVYSCVWAVGYMALSGIAYLLRHRFQFMIITAAPTALIIIPVLFMPESIQWLVAKGRKEEALVVLKRMARMNKRKLPEDIELTIQNDSSGQKTSLFDLIRTPGVRLMSLILWLNFFTDAMTFYAISWNASDIAGNIYLNVFLSGAVELPAYIVTTPLLQKLGRRISFGCTSILAGVFMLSSMAAPGGKGPVLITMIMLSKFFITIAFSVIVQWTTELYPTVARSFGLGVANIWARCGTLIASYLPLFGPLIIPMVCGALCIVSAVPSILLPETLNKVLPTNVTDAEAFAKSVTIRNCCKITSPEDDGYKRIQNEDSEDEDHTKLVQT